MSNKQEIIDLVNSNNPGLALSLDSVDMTTPAIDTDDIVESNTVVTILPKDGSGYKGNVTVHYHRVPMSDIPTPTTLTSNVPFTPEIVLNLLNTQRNTDFVVSEVEPITIPPMDPNVPVTITITATADSYGWTGSTQVDLVYSP